jgi:hypothetical protein
MSNKRARANYHPVPGELFVSFKGQHECLRQLFGEKAIPLSQMQEKLWELMLQYECLQQLFGERAIPREEMVASLAEMQGKLWTFMKEKHLLVDPNKPAAHRSTRPKHRNP